MSQILSLSIFWIILFCVQLSVEVSLDEFLTLSLNEKLKLDEFRSRMIYQVPHDYMKRDVYLIRWLRDSDFDVDTAENRLAGHIQWREENNMDTILDEDWEDLDEEFKYYVEGCTKDGKPVVSTRLGEWDIRKHVLSGNTKRLMRFIDKISEEGDILVRRMQEDGQQVAQGNMLFDMGSFNLVQHGCARCLPVFLYAIRSYLENYPGGTHEIFLVNMPQLAVPSWNVIKTALSPKIRDTVFIFGKDKSTWAPILGKEINKNQLSFIYGGTNPEGLDYAELRATGEAYRCKDHF